MRTDLTDRDRRIMQKEPNSLMAQIIKHSPNKHIASRLMNCMHNADITTTEQLVEMVPRDVLSIYNLGRKCLSVVDKIRVEFGKPTVQDILYEEYRQALLFKLKAIYCDCDEQTQAEFRQWLKNKPLTSERPLLETVSSG